MNAMNLLRSHKYAEAIAACRQTLSVKPNDIAATSIMARALLALEKYKEALPLYERVGADEKQDPMPRGHPGRQIEISCLYWFLGNHPRQLR
jgi:tetratricopeptide (TPR) repeat protein